MDKPWWLLLQLSINITVVCMYWIVENGIYYTITGKANKQVTVHSIKECTVNLTVELNCGIIIDGQMNLNEFINMMEVESHES